MASTDFGFKTVDEQDKARRVRGVFDAVAGKYDVMNDLMSLGLHRAWKAYTLLVADVKPGQRVLEDRKSTRLNSSHSQQSRMPSSA